MNKWIKGVMGVVVAPLNIAAGAYLIESAIEDNKREKRDKENQPVLSRSERRSDYELLHKKRVVKALLGTSDVYVDRDTRHDMRVHDMDIVRYIDRIVPTGSPITELSKEDNLIYNEVCAGILDRIEYITYEARCAAIIYPLIHGRVSSYMDFTKDQLRDIRKYLLSLNNKSSLPTYVKDDLGSMIERLGYKIDGYSTYKCYNNGPSNKQYNHSNSVYKPITQNYNNTNTKNITVNNSTTFTLGGRTISKYGCLYDSQSTDYDIIGWETLKSYCEERDRGKWCIIHDKCYGPVQLHHKVPLSEGGTNEPSNLEWRCELHHTEKHIHMIKALLIQRDTLTI